jgi:aminoglycoside 3-N-acetyltransferase
MSLYQSLTGFIDRNFDDGSKAWLRARWTELRGRTQPAVRAWYGTFDAAALERHLAGQLGSDWDILFVHSSMNGLQSAFTGTALDLVRMLVSFVGPQRTLAMPAFYFGDPDIGGAGETFAERPRFDLRRTPSQMGLPSELFRRSRGVVQSRNPVYRISALGPRAAELVAGHEHAPTLRGAGTPFDVMARANALIIGLGKPFEVLTQVHHPEDMLGEAFPVPLKTSTPLPMTIIDGAEEIAYSLPRSGRAWRRDMWRLRRIMTPAQLREWRFHGVPMFATRAGDVSRMITEAAARGETIYVRP